MKKITYFLLVFVCLLLTSCNSNNSKDYDKKFTVTWKNYDDSVIEVDANMELGTLPTYDGLTPTKPEENGIIYEFIGWDQNITNVTENVTYVAVFEAHNKYNTITWKNEDGTILEIDDNVLYGSIPVYRGKNPSKAEDDHYEYHFSGWSPEINRVKENATYTAQYDKYLKYYDVTWKNWDGTILDVHSYAYGTMPSSSSAFKESTNMYDFIFTGWSPAITQVTGDVTYVAQFKEELRKYTITFDAGEGYFESDSSKTMIMKVAYGHVPQLGITPIGFSKRYATVTFTGWNTNIVKVTGDKTYTAKYKYENENSIFMEYKYSKGENTVSYESIGSDLAVTVDWGDGTINKAKSHSYAARGTGTYYIRFFGMHDRMSFNNLNPNIENVEIYSNSNGYTLYGHNFKNSHIKNISFYGKGINVPEALFTNCLFLENIYIENCISLGNDWLNGYTSLTKVEFGDSSTVSILKGFKNTITLKEFIVPKSVECINSECFYGCTQLNTVTLSSIITTIGNYAFQGCTSLESISLPKSIKAIGDYAFGGCVKLTYIEYASTKADYMKIHFGSSVFASSGVEYIKCTDGILYV